MKKIGEKRFSGEKENNEDNGEGEMGRGGGGGKREEEESREDLHAASRREDRIAREWSRRTGRKGAVHRGESVERARKRRDEREGPRE